jgi:hypothetical protein
MGAMLRYHVAYYLPRGEDRRVVAEVLDFPAVCSQGFDLAEEAARNSANPPRTTP